MPNVDQVTLTCKTQVSIQIQYERSDKTKVCKSEEFKEDRALTEADPLWVKVAE